ncbi:phospholipase D-like domain-containing protein [Saccharopolyspora sp. NPDC002578]
MNLVGEAEDITEWLLTAAERGNTASEIDERHADGRAWSTGNLVRPLVDGAEYFARLRDELRDCRAGDQVYFVSWRGDPAEHLAEPGTAISVELARAVSSGASVHGLVWRSHLDWINRHARENRDFVKMLQVLGGAVVLDQRVRAAGSHHQKFIVIRRPERPDTDVAFVGGIDLSHSRRDDRAHRGDPQPQHHMAAAYGPRPAWHDIHLEIRGPAVSDVEHCFRERWNDPTALQHLPWLWLYDKLRRGATTPLPSVLPVPPKQGEHLVQLLRTYPKKTPRYPFAPRGERSVAHGYAKALRRARRLVYVEDQFFWSPMVAKVFAEALRRNPRLRLVAVVPHAPDGDGKVQVGASDFAHQRALRILYDAGGERVQVYELENENGFPVYVHAKVCVIDDAWAAVGSANLNRRSWTHDSELTAAVCDRGGNNEFARNLRTRLWREHLGHDRDGDGDLTEPDAEVLRHAAARLDEWHAGDQQGPRPPGHLRSHPVPKVSPITRAWAPILARTVFDPDGSPYTPWFRRR